MGMFTYMGVRWLTKRTPSAHERKARWIRDERTIQAERRRREAARQARIERVESAKRLAAFEAGMAAAAAQWEAEAPARRAAHEARLEAEREAAAIRAEHIAAWSNSITTMRDVRRAAWRAIDDLA